MIEQAGSAKALAWLAGTSDSYLSQVRNRVPTASGRPRSIGDRLAARLEQAMGKPLGWIDVPHVVGSEATDFRTQDESSMRDETTPSANAEGPGQGFYPVLSWVQAREWTELSEVSQHDAIEWFRCPVRCSPETFVLRVRGVSMEPQFHDGELIFVDPNVPADHGRFVVVCTLGSNEATFKKLIVEDGQRYLQALNPVWPNPKIQPDMEARVCGVVVFKAEGV